MKNGYLKILGTPEEQPRRSNFNLSRKVRGTFKPGINYPIYWEEVLPDDNFHIKLRALLKTMPTFAPVLGGFKLRVEAYWCPTRNYVREMDMNFRETTFTDQFTLPTFQFYNSDYNGGLYAVAPGSLLDWIGLPAGYAEERGSPTDLHKFNALPILAYYDIMRNFYTNPQESTVPVYVDMGMSANPLFVSLSVQLNRLDTAFSNYYNSAKTTSDFDAFLDTILADPISPALDGVKHLLAQMRPVRDILKENQYNTFMSRSNPIGLMPRMYNDDYFVSKLGNTFYQYQQTNATVNVANNKFSVQSLRLASAMARYLDRSMFGGTRYSDWLKAQFNVNLNKNICIPQFLGSDYQSFAFDDVVSTAQTSPTDIWKENQSLGSIAGRAVSFLDSNESFDFKASEHGIVMFIACLVPDVDYPESIRKSLLKTEFSEIYSPQFDAVGFQPIDGMELCGINRPCFKDGTMVNSYPDLPWEGWTIGVQPAWLEYMTSYNECHGLLQSTMDYWTLSRRNSASRDDTIEISSYIQPELFNYAFSNVDGYTDNFILQFAFDVTANRSISKQLLPTLR